MVGSSGAGTAAVTPGTDAHDQSVAPGIWIEKQCKDTNLQKGTKQAEKMKKRKSGDRQVHLVSRRMAA
ncbi:hypothetical protein H5410_040919 [Solanum commersonii]|uniref:Uncharacterized protein n=1 Tax=Solanum commersonii TaxID=4109 RepID=A0A9J5XRI7_SOLCO|nr:hypothetical protein H5410_040919 [Solanum commersonii]